uniref:BspA family leucine-rich repeat surface protein n=1 Tax=uncultured Dysgonomonas sp. TaxID=206096 RepID=UPI002604B2D7|nr:BspA family leucine-rich repeat surface protein [uncultured Dysgonomonas sp.]
MKKTLLFLNCLLLLLAGCSQNELDQDYVSGSRNSQSNKIRWYGTKLSEGIQTRGVADGTKRWNQDAGVYIKFINSPADQTIIEKVKQTAAEWEEYAGIKFHFVEQDKRADVRIAFDWNNNDWLTWSYTGSDAKFIADQNQPTAVFGGIEYLDETEFKGDVLRLFGQILGLEYEQRHQEWSKNGYWKDASQLQAYWEDQFEGYNMDWSQIRQYVFEPLTEATANQLLETKEIDELSVMAWPYYNRKQTTKLLANYELSEGDKTFIARLYPKTAVTLPTIQEAWVDAGYFTWTDATKTALKITKLGAEQEYLPDVRDGEQLTSANSMFANYRNGLLGNNINLKDVPKFNSSNITDFSYMFLNCYFLTSVPKLDTSKGTNFEYMFGGCISLETIPYIDTSKGTNFAYMFTSCIKLTNIPTLDTSNGVGTAFYFMFEDCLSLTTIPLLNTSKANGFWGMFKGCESLTSVPLLDTSEGTTFAGMFYNCKTIKYIPLLDTSKNTIFRNMFYNCSSLVTIPLLNTSKGEDFSGMFINCSSLTSKPQLDLSNATNVHQMYGGTPWG